MNILSPEFVSTSDENKLISAKPHFIRLNLILHQILLSAIIQRHPLQKSLFVKQYIYTFSCLNELNERLIWIKN